MVQDQHFLDPAAAAFRVQAVSLPKHFAFLWKIPITNCIHFCTGKFRSVGKNDTHCIPLKVKTMDAFRLPVNSVKYVCDAR